MDRFMGNEPKLLPRWITIILGLFFTLITFICVIGSAIIIFSPSVPPSIITISLGSVFLVGSIWVFYLSLRLLIIKPKSNKHYISPNGLRIIALVFAFIPVLSLITGSFWEKPAMYSTMAIGYFGLASALFKMAKNREENA